MAQIRSRIQGPFSICLVVDGTNTVLCLQRGVRGERIVGTVGAGLGKCLKSRQSVMIVAHPLTLTLSPEAEERGFFRLPLPLGEGWGEGAFPRIDAQSCYDVWCVPSFETLSLCPPWAPTRGIGVNFVDDIT